MDIMQKVEHLSNGKVRIAAGTMYGAIENFLKQDLIESVKSDNRRRKVYQTTNLGRKVLKMEAERLRYLVQVAEDYGL